VAALFCAHLGGNKESTLKLTCDNFLFAPESPKPRGKLLRETATIRTLFD
jgi:hypothetical protein